MLLLFFGFARRCGGGCDLRQRDGVRLEAAPAALRFLALDGVLGEPRLPAREALSSPLLCTIVLLGPRGLLLHHLVPDEELLDESLPRCLPLPAAPPLRVLSKPRSH